MLFAEKQQHKKIVITWDTETSECSLKGKPVIRPYLIGWCYDGGFYHSTGDHQKFFDALAELDKTYSLHLYAFNANYDLTATIPEFFSKQGIKKIEYQISDDDTFISCYIRCKKFSIRVFDPMVWNQEVGGLNNWFKLYGIKEKEEIEYEKYNCYIKNDQVIFNNKDGWEVRESLWKELSYLKHDVEGLYKVVEEQLKERECICNDIVKINPKYNRSCIRSTTAPSFSKRVFNTKLMRGADYFDDTFRPIIKEKTHIESFLKYKAMCYSSCGGFTAYNKDIPYYYSVLKLIKSYDVNSMYTYVMIHGLPYGELSETPIKDGFTWYQVKVTNIRWKDKYSYISTSALPGDWCKRKYVYLLKDYWDIVKDYIDTDLKIIKVWYQGRNKEFSGTAWNLFQGKVRAKSIKDEFEKKMTARKFKLLLNSITGKFGEKTYEFETLYNKDTFCFEKSAPKAEVIYRSIMALIYIVQKARSIEIGTTLREIDNGNIFLYSDTDSLKIVELKPVKFKVHPEMLGCFKHEGSYTHFMNPKKSKKYAMWDENNFRETITTAISGLTTKNIVLLKKYATQEQFEIMFDYKNNVCIKDGTPDNKTNHWDQVIIGRTDIRLCGDSMPKTHTIKFNKLKNIWDFL